MKRRPCATTLGNILSNLCVYLERLNTRGPVTRGEKHSCRIHLHQRRAEDGPHRRSSVFRQTRQICFIFPHQCQRQQNYCFTFQQTGCRPRRRLNPHTSGSNAHAYVVKCALYTHTHPMWRCVCGIGIPAGKTFKPVNLTGATGDRIEAPRLNDAGLFLCVAQIKPSSVNALKHPLTGHGTNGGTWK